MTAKQKSRLISYIPIVVIAGLIAGAAYYQEQVTAFFTMRLWDKSAPSKVVGEFLAAVKAGDKAKADSLLGDRSFQNLEKDGKWNGYFIVSNAGILDFTLDSMVGEPIQPSEPEFSTIGPGSALVNANDSSGKAVAYRLEVRDGSWKITEIRGGKPRAGSGMPAPPGTKKSTPKAPAGAPSAAKHAPAVPGGAPTAPKGK